jgi:hypothetical protein
VGCESIEGISAIGGKIGKKQKTISFVKGPTFLVEGRNAVYDA